MFLVCVHSSNKLPRLTPEAITITALQPHNTITLLILTQTSYFLNHEEMARFKCKGLADTPVVDEAVTPTPEPEYERL